jgi:hypothetical protein
MKQRPAVMHKSVFAFVEFRNVRPAGTVPENEL